MPQDNNQLTNLQLLQELTQRMKKNEIGFWIENQDCYLWENTFHCYDKVKVGDLSQTREKWLANWMIELEKYRQESEIRSQLLAKKFQEISDVDLIKELDRRKNKIKLSMCSGSAYVCVEAKDIKAGIIANLPIEIEENHD